MAANPPSPDEAASVAGWVRDWAAWLIAALSVALTGFKFYGRRTREEARDDAMHAADRAAIAALTGRVLNIESALRTSEIKLAEFSSLQLSLERIEDAIARLDSRIDKLMQLAR